MYHEEPQTACASHFSYRLSQRLKYYPLRPLKLTGLNSNMRFLVLAASFSLAAAQSSAASALYSSTATSSSAAVTHTVSVGKAENAFSPNVVLANAGDVIGMPLVVQRTEHS